jgi:hypothetical protein
MRELGERAGDRAGLPDEENARHILRRAETIAARAADSHAGLDPTARRRIAVLRTLAVRTARK